MVQIQEKQNNHHFWQLSGHLTRFENLNDLPQLPCTEAGQVDVSLENVEKIDTAGLAFLIKFKLSLSHKNIEIRYIQPSDNFVKLIKLYDLESMFAV